MNILIAKQLELKILHVLLYKFSNATVRLGLKKRSMKKHGTKSPSNKNKQKMI